MKIRKILIMMTLIILLVLPFFQRYEEAVADEVIKDRNKILNSYAYEISIVKYDGSGEIKKIGKPILVYGDEDFIKEYIYIEGLKNDELPKNYSEFAKWNL